MVYDTFGNMYTDSGSVAADYVSYTGREAERALGLYFYRSRFYDPLVGRFVTRDPIGFYGGDINLYRYVGNNPANFIDPFGWVDIKPPDNHNVGRHVPTCLRLNAPLIFIIKRVVIKM